MDDDKVIRIQATIARLEQILELSEKHDDYAIDMIRILAKRALADQQILLK